MTNSIQLGNFIMGNSKPQFFCWNWLIKLEKVRMHVKKKPRNVVTLGYLEPYKVLIWHSWSCDLSVKMFSGFSIYYYDYYCWKFIFVTKVGHFNIMKLDLQLLPRERKRHDYLDVVKEWFKHLPKIKRIERYVARYNRSYVKNCSKRVSTNM